MKTIILLFISLLSWITFINAQNPQWQNYTCGNNIHALAEEGNLLWIGTTGGLVKFDKNTGIQTFYNTLNSNMPSNYVTSIVVDGNGIKWIGTDHDGLVKFDGTNLEVYTTSNSGIPNDRITSIALDGNGAKWIGTYGGGLAKFNGMNWTIYNSSNSGLPVNYVRSITIDENGVKWIGTNHGGLARFDGSSWAIYYLGLPSEWILSIALEGNVKKWIGTVNGGLAKFDNSNWSTYNTSNSGLPYNRVTSVAAGEGGSVWIGTYFGGLTKFDGTNWTTFNTLNSKLPDNYVTAITIDSYGTKWIGTISGMSAYHETGIPYSVDKKIMTENTLKIYPNPAHDQLNLEKLSGLQVSSVEIMNIQGILVKSQVITNDQYSIDVSDLSCGVYLIRLITDQGSIIKKLVKQ